MYFYFSSPAHYFNRKFRKRTYPVGLLRAGEGAGLLRALGNTGVTGGVKNSSSSSLPRASLTKLKSNGSKVCAGVGVVSLAVDGVICITVTFSSGGEVSPRPSIDRNDL